MLSNCMHIDLSLDSPRAAVCLGRCTVCLVLLRAWQSDGNCCAELPLGCCLLEIPRIPVVHMLRNCTVCRNSLSEMCCTVDLHMQSMLMCENVIIIVCLDNMHGTCTVCQVPAGSVAFTLPALRNLSSNQGMPHPAGFRFQQASRRELRALSTYLCRSSCLRNGNCRILRLIFSTVFVFEVECQC